MSKKFTITFGRECGAGGDYEEREANEASSAYLQ